MGGFMEQAKIETKKYQNDQRKYAEQDRLLLTIIPKNGKREYG